MKSNRKVFEYEDIEQDLLNGLKQGIRINPTVPFGLSVILDNKNISWKAKAIALLILNNEDVFLDITENKEKLLSKSSKDGIESIKTGVKELQNIGLLYKKIRRNKKKHIIGSAWHINIKHEIYPEENIEELKEDF